MNHTYSRYQEEQIAKAKHEKYTAICMGFILFLALASLYLSV